MKKTVLEKLCERLGLPIGGQDWAYEMPESFRSGAELERLCSAYEASSTDDLERALLMEFFLDVANDHLEEGDCAQWERAKAWCLQRPELHRAELERWAEWGRDVEDCAELAPHVRAFISTIGADPG